MTKDEEAARIKEIGPWHVCWRTPLGNLTGDSAPNVRPYKMDNLEGCGAFSKPEYPNVLDLGANSGIIAKWFVDHKGSHVVALECGSKYYPQLEFVIEAFGLQDKIDARNEDIGLCQFGRGGPYDLILFLGTLHHVAQDRHKAIFRACYECLKPGGEFVVQGKRENDAPALMVSAGFTRIKQVYWSDEQDRGGWMTFR